MTLAQARALWDTGNHDARILAMMVADPAAATARVLDAWMRDVDNYVLADALSHFVARTPLAAARAEAWIGRKGEYPAACGWTVLAVMAADEQRDLDDAWLSKHLEAIEAGIHARPNRTRHAMNHALIAIGARGGALEKAALAAAARIGRVEVDHGATGCKTPDAAAYIARTRAHREGRGPGRKKAR